MSWDTFFSRADYFWIFFCYTSLSHGEINSLCCGVQASLMLFFLIHLLLPVGIRVQNCQYYGSSNVILYILYMQCHLEAIVNKI